jgi:hypothetical protein
MAPSSTPREHVGAASNSHAVRADAASPDFFLRPSNRNTATSCFGSEYRAAHPQHDLSHHRTGRGLPLRGAQIAGLGRGDLVKVDCAACHRVALRTPEAHLRLGLSPAAKVLDLKSGSGAGLREERASGADCLSPRIPLSPVEPQHRNSIGFARVSERPTATRSATASATALDGGTQPRSWGRSSAGFRRKYLRRRSPSAPPDRLQAGFNVAPRVNKQPALATVHPSSSSSVFASFRSGVSKPSVNQP